MTPEVRKAAGKGSDAIHLANFLDAVRNGTKLNSEIEEAHKSTLMCHLGNIAQRVGHSLECHAKDGHIQGDRAAMLLWNLLGALAGF